MASQQLPVEVVKKQDKSILELAKELLLIPFDSLVLQSLPEIAHLARVFLTLGTAFMAAISLNYPLAVFSASSFESLLFYTFFKLLADYSITPALS